MKLGKKKVQPAVVEDKPAIEQAPKVEACEHELRRARIGGGYLVCPVCKTQIP